MTAIGALTGLVLTIFLIIRKMNPTYSLILGALTGGLIGGLGLVDTVSVMVDGIKDVTPAIIRILTAGVLSGVLIKTGAAYCIADTLVKKLGQRNILPALALSAMILTAIGVFIDVAVITIAPIALAAGRKIEAPGVMLLLAMIGGGKCGNIISPNPNTIIVAENMNVPLSSVMSVNLIPALVGLLFLTVLLRCVKLQGKKISDVEMTIPVDLPLFRTSIIGPVISIALLALRPIAGITVDPLIALPVGGIVGIFCMGKQQMVKEAISYGLEKMSVVAVLLVGTGTIAGVVKHSSLKDYILQGLDMAGAGEVLIAPLSGALMSAATASTTAGATIASASFSSTIIAAGISAVWGAAMLNSGATVLDHLPHGSFFHATGGSVQMDMKERLKLIPYETLIGVCLATATTVAYLIAG
jgi:GntP family gluconate:H+ symporter